MRLVFSCLLLFVLTSGVSAEDSNQTLKKAIHDYIGLYTKDTLDQWKTLFHPSVIVAFPADDGGITIRNLDEFLERQRNYFAKRKSISERLENVQVFEGKRIARVVADFIFVDEGEERPGKLGLHLVEGTDGWKIVAVIFSYNS
jgi:SnoaL-like domain